MKKRMVMTLALCFSMIGCSNSANVNEKQSSVNESGSFKTAEAKKEKKISYKDANILSFELVSRDDDYSDDTLKTVFKITNNSKEVISYCSLDFAYYDGEGNQISTDGRFNDFSIDSGKSVIMNSYGDTEGVDKSNIKDVKVTEYEYYKGNKYYNVNLQTEKVNDGSHTVNNDGDFDKCNILSFELSDEGNSYGSKKVAVNVTNNGSIPVTYFSYDMAYLDQDGTKLDQDGRFKDEVLEPGKKMLSQSYMSEEEYIDNISSFGVYQYEYKLSEKDANGFNKYEIDLQTKEVKGSFVED